MNTATRVRLARKRADRLNLKLIKNGHHFRLRDADEITLAVGHLGVVEAFLAAAKSQNKPPGPPPSLHAPPSWRRDIDDYLLNLNAAGQRPATIRLRKTVLCAAAHGLGRPPADVTAEPPPGLARQTAAPLPRGPQNLSQHVAGLLRVGLRNGPGARLCRRLPA